MAENSSNNKVLVIGGGAAGIQAALDLADQGNKVIIVEQFPSIGGHMAQLDKTFPTNDCSICILAPKMVECARHPNITIYSYSEIIESKRENSWFKVKIKKKQRYINEEKCTGCRSCSDICPVKVPNEFDCGLRLRSAIYIPFAQAVPNVAVLDKDSCIECRSCIKKCPSDAIEFDNPEEGEIIEVKVQSIILATGYDLFDPTPISRYHYADLKNVLTGLEFERLMCASGPTGGKIIRLSDDNPVKEIVIVHCVGSRNINYNEYCSKVCCMYATKQAIITKEHAPETRIRILYNDMRAYGKGFQEYIERAKENYKVEYIKSYPYSIEKDPNSEKLIVTFEDISTQKLEKVTADLAVLCTTMVPSKSTEKLSKILGVDVDKYGFIKTEDSINPIITNKPGIYVIGACEGPKDIPESISEASASASFACSSRQKKHSEKQKPDLMEISDELRIGVFVCHCGTNIGGVVNVKEVVDEIRNEPNIVYATDNLYTCSNDTQDLIKQAIKDNKLNRVIIASCTPRTHEELFMKTCEEGGLNPYLFEFANIREQCSWVHINEPEKATEKAKDLVKMAIARARYLKSQSPIEVDINPSVLIIGGGVSGLAAASAILDKGFKVNLIEKKDKVGGYLNRLHGVNNNFQDPQAIIKDLEDKKVNNKNLNLYTKTEIINIKGSIGDFEVEIKNKEGNKVIHVGVIIVAIGAQEFIPNNYFGYNTSEKILTQTQFHNLLNSKEYLEGIRQREKIAFIQCVGAREEKEEGNTYCSNICCANSLRIIKYLKKKVPNIETIIFYRDINVYGKDENLYRDVRTLGTTFVRYDKKNPPEVSEKNGNFLIRSSLISRDYDVEITVDRIILATPLIPSDDTERLSKLLKIPQSYNGFFLEAHVKHRPLDFATDGIYLCGTCQSPKSIKESIAQGRGAASRALIPLKRGKIDAEPIYAEVDQDSCISCEICELTCPFGAVSLEETSQNVFKAKVNPVLCKGCGACAAACPVNAINMKHFTDQQIKSMIDSSVEDSKETEPRIVTFLCNWCSYAGADNAGVSRFQYPVNIRPIRVMCSARISINHILEAFRAGADGVLVTGCHLGDCHYLTGNFKTQRRVRMAKILLQNIGINPDRLQLSWCSASEGKQFAEIVKNFVNKIKKINDMKTRTLETEVIG
ncbi:MAG: hydrogenase iron-sulfur subunit [Candidatus Lokiarchaeota archaeon]|nr:hydrogenase iron-sulfur subunit [Candidatus Lokiarchaeota archaeon]